MKNQNTNIPFVVHRKSSIARLYLGTDEKVDTLLLDPQGILVEYAGSYGYISKAEVANAVRVLRDHLKLDSSIVKELRFDAQIGDRVLGELGLAIEIQAAKIEALQKKCEENDSHTSDCG